MRARRLASWAIFIAALLFFALPLLGMFEFSLRARRGTWSFDAYANVLRDPQFLATLGYSIALSFGTILLGILIVVPTAFWVRLKFRRFRPVVEFITVLPLVIPPIVIVFGYLRLYNTSSWLPLTASTTGTDLLLSLGYVTLSLPYMYRAIDNGLGAFDLKALTEAAQSLGAGWGRILFRIILPNVLVAVLSGAFITFAIVIGEYVFAALMNRPAFGPYMVWTGSNKAYEPAALAVVAFGLTWGAMALMQVTASLFGARRTR